MDQIKTVCVYCGSGPGSSPRFVEAALALGKTFAENNIRPRLWRRIGRADGRDRQIHAGSRRPGHRHHSGFLRSREHMLTRVQEMIVTPDMHERKRLMFEHSDAFVALPGGVGTLEELVEQMTSAAARPSHQAGAARQHRRLLGAAGSRCWRICAKPSSSARR